MPEVPEQGGQGEAKADTKSGSKEAKEGEEMITVDDAIKGAKMLAVWCKEHKSSCEGCPFDDGKDDMCAFRIPPADVLVEEYIKNWEAAK